MQNIYLQALNIHPKLFISNYSSELFIYLYSLTVIDHRGMMTSPVSKSSNIRYLFVTKNKIPEPILKLHPNNIEQIT